MSVHLMDKNWLRCSLGCPSNARTIAPANYNSNTSARSSSLRTAKLSPNATGRSGICGTKQGTCRKSATSAKHKIDQLMLFLEKYPRYMTAKDILDAGFNFSGQTSTSLRDVRNIIAKLPEVERLYDEANNKEVRIMAKNAIWRNILRKKK